MNLIYPKLVIFDWDNTLVNSWDKISACINHVMRSFNLDEWTLDKVKATMHKSSREFFPNTFKEEWQRARDVFYDYYNSNFVDKVEVLIDAELTLKALKNRDVKMAVISNKTGKNLRAEIQILGWDKYFDSVLGAYDLPHDKPNPIVVEHTLKVLNLSPGYHIWFVGDTIVDIECAVNSGCWPVLFGEQIIGSPHPKDKSINHSHFLSHKHFIKELDECAVKYDQSK